MRHGNTTASRALDFMSAPRSKSDGLFGDTAKAYALELALIRIGVDVELITGMQVSTWQMDWGNLYEPDARVIYEQSREMTVELPGYIEGPAKTGFICDGYCGTKGILEIKCPQWSNHLKYYMHGVKDGDKWIARNYYYQMQFQMMITGRLWTDFMTFHPEMPDHLKAKVHRYHRDEALIGQMLERIPAFNQLIEDTMKRLQP